MHRLHGDSSGVINRRRGKYVDLLSDLFAASRDWPNRSSRSGTAMFGGNPARNGKQPELATEGDGVPKLAESPRLQISLPVYSGKNALLSSDGTRVAESVDELLSVHPIVVGNAIVYQFGPDPEQIAARRLTDGRLLFGPQEHAIEDRAAPNGRGDPLRSVDDLSTRCVEGIAKAAAKGVDRSP